MAVAQKWIAAMTPEDKRFYRELGQRIAELRKAQGLTQVQLAEILGIAQQTMAHYEGGSLRVAVSLLKPLSRALNVSLEELLDDEPKRGKRGPAPKIQRQLERINQLPRSKQKFVMEMLETVIQQQSASH